MPLSQGQDLALPQRKSFRAGRIAMHGMRAMLSAMKYVIPIADIPDIQEKTVASVTGTAASHSVAASATKVYGARCETPSGGNDDMIVSILDNAIIVASFKAVQAGNDAEAWFYGGSEGVGLTVTGPLTVKATKADGSTAPDAADRPTVIVYFG